MHAPKVPDRWVCSPTYGTNIIPVECDLLVDNLWPTGNTPINYYFRDPTPSNAIRLPKTNIWGSCQMAIEPGGPPTSYPNFLKLRPNEIRGLAGYVIEKCAAEMGGIGGFVTLGFGAAETYVQSVTNDWSDDMKNASGINSFPISADNPA